MTVSLRATMPATGVSTRAQPAARRHSRSDFEAFPGTSQTRGRRARRPTLLSSSWPATERGEGREEEGVERECLEGAEEELLRRFGEGEDKAEVFDQKNFGRHGVCSEED